MTNAEARFNNSLRPRKPEGSLERTAQDVHLDSHTASELCVHTPFSFLFKGVFVIVLFLFVCLFVFVGIQIWYCTRILIYVKLRRKGRRNH